MLRLQGGFWYVSGYFLNLPTAGTYLQSVTHGKEREADIEPGYSRGQIRRKHAYFIAQN